MLTLPWINQGVSPPLARALASGAAPALRSFNVSMGNVEEDLEALAAMLEERAQRPACCRLEKISAGGCVPIALPRQLAVECCVPRCRPSGSSMDSGGILRWEPCFIAARAPELKKCMSCPCPSVSVLEAMPELEELMAASERMHLALAEIEPFTQSLRRGVAFQRLTHLELSACRFELAEWRVLRRLRPHCPVSCVRVAAAPCGAMCVGRNTESALETA